MKHVTVRLVMLLLIRRTPFHLETSVKSRHFTVARVLVSVRTRCSISDYMVMIRQPLGPGATPGGSFGRQSAGQRFYTTEDRQLAASFLSVLLRV